MPTEPKHTPHSPGTLTPIVLEGWELPKGDYLALTNGGRHDGKIKCIAILGQMGAPNQDVSIADAGHIQRMWNNHEALVALLRDAYDRMTNNDMMPPNTKLRAWLDRTQQALAKAEGRPE